jgi:hypothetical protein
VPISRVLMSATLAGVLVFTAVPRAQAMDPYTQDLLTQMLSGLVLGAPYSDPGNLPSGSYGTSPYLEFYQFKLPLVAVNHWYD